MVTDGLDVGTILNNRFRVDGVLGQGGFAITYLGFDLTLQRRIALKELFLEGCTRQDRTVVPSRTVAESFQTTLDRFALEARTLASFDHPSIVTVYEVFEENGTAYLVMEYLDGTTLDEFVARSGPMSAGRLRPVLDELLSALSLVHSKGLLHRDIKPSNVMIGEQGRVALIDFGAARSFQANSSTHTKLVSYGYSPIEQFGSTPLTPAADLYALSATAYFALTGMAPPASTERAAGTVTLAATTSFTTDQPLGSVVLMGLDMAAMRRPQSADEYRSLLGDQPAHQRTTSPNRTVLLDDTPRLTTPSSFVAPARQGTPKGVLIGAGLVIAALCGALITVIVRKDLPTRIATAPTEIPSAGEANPNDTLPTTITITSTVSADTISGGSTPSDDAGVVPLDAKETTTTVPSPTPLPPEPPRASEPIRGVVEGTNGDDDITNRKGEGYVSQRTSPNSKSREVGQIDEGDSVTIVCQVIGTRAPSSKNGASNVWDRLDDGTYIAHIYVESGTSRYRITNSC
jgi:serine/threonine protein kinase